MARLGEQLAATGVVSPEKVEQALRAQVVWGGRLGTNLIELGCIDLDGLSRALGQQHNVPAALARHFDKADPELQALLPQRLAKQFSVVPLVRLSPEQIAVVALDPLSPEALAALADIYGCEPAGIVMSVAAEMRVLYHLERVYKIPRPTRYLRSKGASITPFPQFNNVPVEIDSDTDIAVPIVIDEREHPTGAVERPVAQVGNADDIAAMIDLAIETATTPPLADDEPRGRDRRTYLRTLADAVEPATGSDRSDGTPAYVERVDASAIESTGAQRVEPGSEISKSGALARIAIRRVAVSTTTTTTTPPTATAVHAAVHAAGTAQTMELRTIPSNLPEAVRAIKRGPHRDRVADMVIETLERFVPACEAALLLVIRGDVAIGWKEFCRTGDATTDIAVPLDQEGMIPTVISENRIARAGGDSLGSLDGRLLRALGRTDGELAIVPISVGDQVMCVIAAATESGAALDAIESVTAAAGAAFTRLIRDASR